MTDDGLIDDSEGVVAELSKHVLASIREHGACEVKTYGRDAQIWEAAIKVQLRFGLDFAYDEARDVIRLSAR